jgi:hypothetical protein
MIYKTAKAYDVEIFDLDTVPRLSYVLGNAGQWGAKELLIEYHDRMKRFIESEFDLGVNVNALDS